MLNYFVYDFVVVFCDGGVGKISFRLFDVEFGFVNDVGGIVGKT